MASRLIFLLKLTKVVYGTHDTKGLFRFTQFKMTVLILIGYFLITKSALRFNHLALYRVSDRTGCVKTTKRALFKDLLTILSEMFN